MIQSFETETIEYKKSTSEIKEAIISLSSMLNKNGYGTLYFGVLDNGQIVGQQIGDRTLRDISQAIANYIKPQVIPTITLELMDNKNVIKVYVEDHSTPYSAYGKYYIRSYDEDRELTPEQLKKLMLKAEEVDKITKMEADEQDLSFLKLKSLYLLKELNFNNDSFEKNTGLVLDNGKYNYLGYLLADKNDISIKVVVFKGKDKKEIIKRNEYGFKCLIVAMDQVLNYVESLNETNVNITSHTRKEDELFDMASFREAWINACLHTKWEKKNPPAVYIYKDRIEIISTGGLSNDLTLEEFYKGISKPTNIKLQKILSQLGYVEQTGHGVPLIISNYGKQAFEIMDNYLNVTIPFKKELKGGKKDLYNLSLNDSERIIYSFVDDNPTYTIRDLVRESDFSDGYVRKILTNLKDKKYIKRVGSNKTGYWKTNKKK